MKRKASSLTAQLGALLLLSAGLGTLLFCAVYFGGGALMEQYFEHSDFQEQAILRRVEHLQDHVSKNELSTKDVQEITHWTKKQAVILLEIYRSNVLLYSSSAPDQLLGEENELEAPYYNCVSYYQVAFSDGEAEVVIYANDTYRWFMILTVAGLILSFLLFLLVFLRGCRNVVRYICLLSEEIQVMEVGGLEAPVTIQGEHELAQLAKSLDSMRVAFKKQREREAALLQANQALITEMSHDLRTPLTTLQIYTDILRFKKYAPGQLDEYLAKVDGKAAQIKQLAENLFEYSLVSRGQEIVRDKPAPFREVFHDSLSEMAAYLGQRGFSFELELDWPALSVAVHPPYIKRIIDNIASNIVKYADPSKPIGIKTALLENGAALSVWNAVQAGDTGQESTQIGLPNMRTMMEKMGGQCRIQQTSTQFQITLWFPDGLKRVNGREGK